MFVFPSSESFAGPFPSFSDREDQKEEEEVFAPPVEGKKVELFDTLSFYRYLDSEQWEKAFLQVPYFFSPDFSCTEFLLRLQSYPEDKLQAFFLHTHFPWYVFSREQLLQLIENKTPKTLLCGMKSLSFPWKQLQEEDIFEFFEYLSGDEKWSLATFIPWTAFSPSGRRRFQSNFCIQRLSELMQQAHYPWDAIDPRFLSLKLKEMPSSSREAVLQLKNFPWLRFSLRDIFQWLQELQPSSACSLIHDHPFLLNMFSSQELVELIKNFSSEERHLLLFHHPQLWEKSCADHLMLYLEKLSPPQKKSLLFLPHFPWEKFSSEWVFEWVFHLPSADLSAFMKEPSFPWELFSDSQLQKLKGKFWFWEQPKFKK